MAIIFLSENACAPLTQALENDGHDIYKVLSTDVVYPAISAHADIYMCRVGDTLLIDDTILTDPPVMEQYMEELERQSEDFTEKPVIPAMASKDGQGHIVLSMGGIGYEYPDDVPYNAIATNRFFIHNTDLTSPALLDRARFAGLQIINVKQGYTRCSCLPVGSKAFITSDEGIARTLRAWNEMIRSEAAAAEADCDDEERISLMNDIVDILLIRPGYIRLEGFEHGFIGGTAGAVGNKIYFNGDITEHPDSDLIIRFIEDHAFTPIWFADEPLTDIGSIFSI